MTQKEVLMSYILNNRVRLEGEFQRSQQQIRYRRIDTVDCLECIIAQTRLQAFEEFAAHIMHLMKMNLPDDLQKQYITVEFIQSLKDILKKGSAEK